MELLTEHNCIVEELCKAWGPGFQSRRHPDQLRRSPTRDPNISSVQEQGMANTQLPNPHPPDPPVLCVEDGCSAWEAGYDPGRCLPKNPNTISVQGQEMSLTRTQMPNPPLPLPPILQAGERCIPWDLIRGQEDVFLRMLAQIQAKNAGCLPKNPNTISVQGQEMSLTSTQMPNPHLPDPPVLCVEDECCAWEAGYDPGRCLPKNPNTISVQGQEISMTSTQMPNPPLPLPPIQQAGERCIPWDLIRGQEDVFLRMLAQIQAKNAGCL